MRAVGHESDASLRGGEAGVEADPPRGADASIWLHDTADVFDGAVERLRDMGYRVTIDASVARDWRGTRRRQLSQAGLEVGARLVSLRVARFAALRSPDSREVDSRAQGWLEEWRFDGPATADVVAHGLRAGRGLDLYGSVFFGKSPHVMHRLGDLILSARVRPADDRARLLGVDVLLRFLGEGREPPLEVVVGPGGEGAPDAGGTVELVEPALIGMSSTGLGSEVASIRLRPSSGQRTGARLVLGAVSVEGGLSIAQVEGVARANLGDLCRCHTESLDRNSNLAGAVRLTLEIGADGKVRSAFAPGAAVDDLELKRCFAGVASGWVFPESELEPTTAVVSVEMSPISP